MNKQEVPGTVRSFPLEGEKPSGYCTESHDEMEGVSTFAIVWIVFLAVWTALSFGVGKLARIEGRSFNGWFLLSLLVSPLVAALLVLFLDAPHRTPNRETQAEPLSRAGIVVSAALALFLMIGGFSLGDWMAEAYAWPYGLPAAGAVFGLAVGLGASYLLQRAFPRFMTKSSDH